MESETLVDDTHDRNYDLNIYDDHLRDFITIRPIYIYIILSKLFMICKLLNKLTRLKY